MYRDLLYQFTDMCKNILGGNLTGVYLHGSLAMGCFHPKKSDLDLIVVVKNEVPDETKMHFMEKVICLNERAPEKGIEMSIVREQFCKLFVYPTPFELHFSATHLVWFQKSPEDYIARMKGTDKDLAAHFTIIRHGGKVLYGAPIEAVFGEVPKKDYLDSIWYDVAGAAEDITDDPVYVILNLCRVLGYLQEELILSKKTGGEWGLKHIEEKYRELIAGAVNCYEAGRKLQCLEEENTMVCGKQVISFAETMLRKIKETAHEQGFNI